MTTFQKSFTDVKILQLSQADNELYINNKFPTKPSLTATVKYWLMDFGR
jgi:hypothetical protein